MMFDGLASQVSDPLEDFQWDQIPGDMLGLPSTFDSLAELSLDNTVTSSVASVAQSRYGLPPCKVCAAKGTGFHYGVNTCEACKGFFRRSLIRHEPYVCRKSSKCELLAGKRNMCAKCRLEKCLQAGMSVQGIKTGRYTYEKRRKDTVAVRLMQAEVALASQQRVESTRQADITELIHSVVDARRRYYHDHGEDINHVAQLQIEFARSRRGRKSMFDDLTPVQGPDNALVAPGRTGGDSSGDDQEYDVFHRWLKLLEFGVKKVINFAKALPGFRQLDMNDQISLFKNSMCEVWVVSRACAINTELKCFTSHSGMTFDLVQVWGAEYTDAMLSVARRIQNLNLTYEENAVLSGYLIFSPDRFELDLHFPEQVRSTQARFLEALQWLLKQNHSDALTFPRLTAALTEMRTLTELYHKNNEQILIKNFQSSMLEIPPLFWELITT